MKRTLLSLLLLLPALLHAQKTVNEILLEKAIKLKVERKDEDAFPIFQQLLRSDSTNVEYLEYTSYCYSRMGHRQATEEMQMRYYHIAEYLAKKAIARDNNSAEAHFSYVLALGRLNENASSKQKVANAKLIKTEADRVIALNPKHAGAWHVLGRWNREIAGFNTVEKAMINSFFGGVPPGATYERAVECFKTAISLEGDYMLHKYELAMTYHKMDKDADAKKMVQEAMKLPQKNADDKDTYKKCEELLKDLD